MSENLQMSSAHRKWHIRDDDDDGEDDTWEPYVSKEERIK